MTTTNLQFINAQEMSKRFPDTFTVPSDEELASIAPSSIVKVAHGDERFWVRVLSVADNGTITAKVSNNLIGDHGFNHGDTITFHKENVYQLYDEDEALIKFFDVHGPLAFSMLPEKLAMRLAEIIDAAIELAEDEAEAEEAELAIELAARPVA